MSTSPLTSRRIRLQDVDGVEQDVQRLWESNPEYCRAAGEVNSDGQVPPDHARAFLHEELAPPGGRVHVYSIEGQIVAVTASLVPHPREPLPWIGLLLVDGRRQGQRIGAACTAMVHEELAGEGWSEVRLAVLDTNPRALPFWHQQGYIAVDRRPDRAGRWCTVLRRPLHGKTS